MIIYFSLMQLTFNCIFILFNIIPHCPCMTPTADIEVATTTYSVTISYPTEYQYIYTQPQPQGHRSLLWKMDENGHVTTVAERYTALPSRSTTIYSLQPNTLYSLHTWANESCYSWMVTVTTTPLGIYTYTHMQIMVCII